MKFKGTIIITDPCYITKDSFDWSKCNYGLNMEVLGIHNYITESTIYGDWSCITYSIENPIETITKISEIKSSFNDFYLDSLSDKEYDDVCDVYQSRMTSTLYNAKELGHFCADAGLVSVFLLDEVLKYNPDFSKWAEEHPWCVTTISNFDGAVEYYVDEAGDAHIVGTGNINFFTTQTNL